MTSAGKIIMSQRLYGSQYVEARALRQVLVTCNVENI
jgi:hypothetical protein